MDIDVANEFIINYNGDENNIGELIGTLKALNLHMKESTFYFSPEGARSLANIFTSDGTYEAQLLILDLISQQEVLDHATLDVLVKWYLINKEQSTNIREKLILQLLDSLHSGAITKSAVRPYYFLILQTLCCEETTTPVIQFLMAAADHKSVTPRVVKLTSRLYHKNDNKVIAHLLKVFLNYYPELIQDDLKNRLNKTNGFMRKPDLDPTKVELNSSMETKTCSTGIPSPFFSEEELQHRFKFTSFSSLKEVPSVSAIALPTNVLSLLRNQVGFHLLAHGPKEQLLHFSSLVGVELEMRFNPHFLQAVTEFEEYIQEGVLSTLGFLERFLPSWDCFSCQKPVFAAIAWVPFSSFEELYQKIFVPLDTIFQTASIKLKHRIVTCLLQLLTNVAFLKRRFQNGGQLKFRQANEWLTEESGDVLRNISQFIFDLVRKGSAYEQLSSVFLHEALRVSHKVTLLDEKLNLNLWSSVSPVVIYGGFMSKNVSHLNIVCQILHSYEMKIASLQKGELPEPNDDLDWIESLISDLHSFLTPGKGWPEFPHLLGFLNLCPEKAERLLTSTSLESDLDLESNFSTCHLIEFLCKKKKVGFKRGSKEVLNYFMNGIYTFLEDHNKQCTPE